MLRPTYWCISFIYLSICTWYTSCNLSFQVFDLLKQYDISQDHYRQYFGGSFRQEDDCAKVTEELGY